MLLLCRIGLHKAVPSQIWNAGLYFSRCRRCGQDMIRRPNEKWKLVPDDQQVVWRRSTERNVAMIVPRHVGRESLPGLLSDMGMFVRPEAPPPPPCVAEKASERPIFFQTSSGSSGQG